jgi:hypothetical protein
MNNLLPLKLPEASLSDLGWNLALGILLSAITAWHYSRRAKKKVLRRDLGLVLPVIALTTLLVISVVKSSLALSLGLVGALSIVRFRTPIKEPEELAYIFLAIAVGLSLGADQRETAALGVIVILAVISSTDALRNVKQTPEGNLLITMNMPPSNTSENDSDIEQATILLSKIADDVNVRRIDKGSNRLCITCLAHFSGLSDVNDFSKNFEEAFPEGSFTLIDDSAFPNE